MIFDARKVGARSDCVAGGETLRLGPVPEGALERGMTPGALWSLRGRDVVRAGPTAAAAPERLAPPAGPPSELARAPGWPGGMPEGRAAGVPAPPVPAAC